MNEKCALLEERAGGKTDILWENDKNKHPFRLQFWDNNPTYPLSECIIPPKSVYMSAPLALSRRESIKTQVSGPGSSVGPPSHSISQIFLFSSADGNFTFPPFVCSHAAPAQSDWISHFRSALRRVGFDCARQGWILQQKSDLSGLVMHARHLAMTWSNVRWYWTTLVWHLSDGGGFRADSSHFIALIPRSFNPVWRKLRLAFVERGKKYPHWLPISIPLHLKLLWTIYAGVSASCFDWQVEPGRGRENERERERKGARSIFVFCGGGKKKMKANMKKMALSFEIKG